MLIFLLHFSLLLLSQPMHLQCIFSQEGRSNKLILHCRENFQPFQPIYYCTETDIHFSMFEDGCHFPDGCYEATSCVFLFPFLHWHFSSTENTTQILVFLNIHFGILTWNMRHLLCLCTIFACWPQIVNFISPNYAQSSQSLVSCGQILKVNF